MLLCSGCNFGESDNLIPGYNYKQIFVEKRLSAGKGDVEYIKNEDEKKINKITELLNSVPIEAPGSKQTKEIESKLNEKGAYIVSFLTQSDLDNRTTESVYYLALLQDGHIVYSGHNDQEMNVRLVSAEKKPKLVKEIIDKLY